MQSRSLGRFAVSALGLGCMSMSHGYGTPDDAESRKVLHRALDLGCTHFDTAALYGFGRNESLIGQTLKDRRGDLVLATKGGMFKGATGYREINGHPDALRQSCEHSLRRLQTDVIDLYYLHRVDPLVPLAESIGALAELVKAGKIRSIGLSEVSAATLRAAHAIHPIAAVQSEYSLWTRNPEIEVLSTCRELGVTFVAFSPLARGFLSGRLRDVSALPERDIRRRLPRFQYSNFDKNLALLPAFTALAAANACTPAQLALAWLLAQGPHILPIPGSSRLHHLEENLRRPSLVLAPEVIARAGSLINQFTVAGPRYDATTQREIGTEEFASVA